LVAEMRRRVHDAEAVGHADDDAARTEERLATPESQRKAHAGERNERVVLRAIEERRRQADDDDVGGWPGAHETPVGLGPGGGADAVSGSGEDVDDATAIGHRLHVEDGPRPGPIDDRGDGALAPLVEHRVGITVTGIGMADAVTAVMAGEAAN